MDRLKRYYSRAGQDDLRHLHSNMDRLKHEIEREIIAKLVHLHSNMDRLKRGESCETQGIGYLHSNMDRLKQASSVSALKSASFTFQYG